MADEKKDKDEGSEAGKEKAGKVADNPAGDEGELSEVKPKNTGEPSDNLHRRSDWFQKRH